MKRLILIAQLLCLLSMEILIPLICEMACLLFNINLGSIMNDMQVTAEDMLLCFALLLESAAEAIFSALKV